MLKAWALVRIFLAVVLALFGRVAGKVFFLAHFNMVGAGVVDGLLAGAGVSLAVGAAGGKGIAGEIPANFVDEFLLALLEFFGGMLFRKLQAAVGVFRVLAEILATFKRITAERVAGTLKHFVLVVAVFFRGVLFGKGHAARLVGGSATECLAGFHRAAAELALGGLEHIVILFPLCFTQSVLAGEVLARRVVGGRFAKRAALVNGAAVAEFGDGESNAVLLSKFLIALGGAHPAVENVFFIRPAGGAVTRDLAVEIALTRIAAAAKFGNRIWRLPLGLRHRRQEQETRGY